MDTKDGAPRRGRQPTLALYRQARSGDPRAVDELYSRYLPRLVRWAEARVGPRARELVDTDAVVRKALLDTLEHSSGREPERGDGFLGEARQAIDESLASELRARARGDANGVADHPDRYERAFRELSLSDQSVIAARLEEGASYEEIAEEAGLASAEQARKRVSEAILRLAERMRTGR